MEMFSQGTLGVTEPVIPIVQFIYAVYVITVYMEMKLRQRHEEGQNDDKESNLPPAC